MKKTVLSCVAILSLCVAMPAMADIDETFMDWSYASGLDPKPRPQPQERQKRMPNTSIDTTIDVEMLDTDIFATSEIEQTSMTQNNTFNGSEYANASYTSAQNTAQEAQFFDISMDKNTGSQAWEGNDQNTYNALNTQNVQTTIPQYYQVPIQTIQTPAEIHRINNPVKVQYPVTKQYPISMQYPVTIQKEITVQRPVVVQQPIVVQRPIVMQQPVMVQHQPLMVQNKPLMVQQQPTVVQKQPIVVNAPASNIMPAPAMPTPVAHMVQRSVQTPCEMAARQQHIMPQPVVPANHQALPTTPVIQIPVHVNGTLTGTLMPSTGCNNGCVK